MKISKKKLKKRLLDICLGAGMHWIKESEFFARDNDLESVFRAIVGIEWAFDIDIEQSIIRFPSNLPKFENIDDLTDLVARAIEVKEGV